MTKFVFQGSGHTTGGGSPVGAGLAVAGVVALLASGGAKGAASALGDILLVVAGVLGILIVGVTAVVILRVRGHRRNPADAPSPLLCTVSPQPIPVREAPRAIAAPAAPVVNNFFGADATAAFLREQAMAYRTTTEPVEQHQEIQP